MSPPTGLRLVAVVACWIAVTCCPALARAQSAVDGFDPGANGPVYALATQPDGKILIAGGFTMLGGGGTGTSPRNSLGRLNIDGSLDTAFNPGANSTVNALTVQPDRKILLGGGFTTLGAGGTGTTARNYLGRLNSDGTLDTSFDPSPNNPVFALANQPADGKVLVGGQFTAFRGGAAGTTPYLGRLNADGSADPSFIPGPNNVVRTLAVQPDGKILAGGDFTTIPGGFPFGTTCNRLARFNANGSSDTCFGKGAESDTVHAVVLQSDGRILVGGQFQALAGSLHRYVGRFYADGSLDASLDPGANGTVYALSLEPDGKILVGGDLTSLGGGGTGTTVRNYLGRVNPDRSLDNFDPGANGSVLTAAVQSDSRILVGGRFTTLGGGATGTTARNYLGRLNSDGSLDTTFDPGADGYVDVLAVQFDGKILVGGEFTTLGGTTHNYLGRLNPDGSVDTSFANPIAALPSGAVYDLTVQPDGKILVGGFFTTLGAARHNLARLNPDGSLDASFDPGADSTIRSCRAARRQNPRRRRFHDAGRWRARHDDSQPSGSIQY